MVVVRHPVHGRKRVELSIWNNIDGELEGPYEIYLGEGRELCAILEEYTEARCGVV